MDTCSLESDCDVPQALGVSSADSSLRYSWTCSEAACLELDLQNSMRTSGGVSSCEYGGQVARHEQDRESQGHLEFI